eukprot:8977082-Lingulodinium_polyedra.AAC.1
MSQQLLRLRNGRGLALQNVRRRSPRLRLTRRCHRPDPGLGKQNTANRGRGWVNATALRRAHIDR